MKVSLPLIQAVWFNIGWFGCVYSAQKQLGWLALVFPLVSVLLFLKSKILSGKVVMALSLILIVGCLFDFVAYRAGLVSFTIPAEVFIPVWLVSMWLMYVLVMPALNGLFGGRWWLAAALGAVFGPLSYYSGSAFDVLNLNSNLAILVYAIFWATFFPGSIFVFARSASPASKE